MKEKIDKDIALSREVFNSLPVNTENNRKKYLKEISKEIDQYNQSLSDIYAELEVRQAPYKSLNPNNYDDINQTLKQLSKAMSYTNNLSGPYEKLKIDKIIYQLANYENDNLLDNNEKILKALKIFKIAGINLSKADFNYTKYVSEYMNEFFNYTYDLNNDNLKNTFDKIYWKCPNLLLEVELNIRYLFKQNEDKFNKYIDSINQELVSSFVNGVDTVIKDYAHLRQKMDNDKFNDKNQLLLDFYNEDKKVSDYTGDKIKKISDDLFGPNGPADGVALKMLNSLKEYKGYLKYQDLIENIKKLYNEKLEDNFLNQSNKKIKDLEAQLFKLDKKSTKSSSNTKVDKLEPQIDDLIKQIKDIYNAIDKEMPKIIVKKNLAVNSTLFKALLMACQYYSFLAEYFLKKENDLTYQQIDERIKELLNFVLDPHNTLINNITILEEVDVAEIVVANYNLFNINIDKDMISSSNLDSLIESLEKILIFDELKKLDISISSLEDMRDIKMIEEKNIEKK